MTDQYIKVDRTLILRAGDVLHVFERDGQNCFGVIPHEALSGRGAKPTPKPTPAAELTHGQHRSDNGPVMRGKLAEQMRDRVFEALRLMPGRSALEVADLLSVHGYRMSQITGVLYRAEIAGDVIAEKSTGVKRYTAQDRAGGQS